MDKAIFLLGATGTGKSDLAIMLAKEYDCEIISADSVQIFKGFDIGSAKISGKEMQGIIHHAIDIADSTEYFSVFDFVEYTRKKIKEINAKGKLPLVVGGTGLYIKAILGGYDFGGANKNDNFRQQQEEYAKLYGNDALWQRLNAQAPELAQRIDKNNTKRVIRALEIARFGHKQKKSKIDMQSLTFALTMQRELLYERINNRVDKMVANGLFEEVEGLLKKGVPTNCQPMQAIGYKEVVAYFNGKSTKEDAINLVKQHSRNYAKRQETFLRGMDNIIYVDVQDKDRAFKDISSQIKDFLSGESK